MATIQPVDPGVALAAHQQTQQEQADKFNGRLQAALAWTYGRSEDEEILSLLACIAAAAEHAVSLESPQARAAFLAALATGRFTGPTVPVGVRPNARAVSAGSGSGVTYEQVRAANPEYDDDDERIIFECVEKMHQPNGIDIIGGPGRRRIVNLDANCNQISRQPNNSGGQGNQGGGNANNTGGQNNQGGNNTTGNQQGNNATGTTQGNQGSQTGGNANNAGTGGTTANNTPAVLATVIPQTSGGLPRRQRP